MLQLYMKCFPHNPIEQCFCGVIVNIDKENESGEVVDAIMTSSAKEVHQWYATVITERGNDER